jgi:hypothetical protein
VGKWGRECAKKLAPLNRKVARWVADNLSSLQNATPQVPDLGSDRAEDNWIPLLAIADVVGGDWPGKARKAAKTIARGVREDESPGIQLLADLRTLLTQKNQIVSHQKVSFNRSREWNIGPGPNGSKANRSQLPNWRMS